MCCGSIGIHMSVWGVNVCWQPAVSRRVVRRATGTVHCRWWRRWETGALLCTCRCLRTTRLTSESSLNFSAAHFSTIRNVQKHGCLPGTAAYHIPQKCHSRQLLGRKVSTGIRQWGIWVHRRLYRPQHRQPGRLPANVVCSACSSEGGSFRWAVSSNAGLRNYSRVRRATGDDIHLVKHWTFFQWSIGCDLEWPCVAVWVMYK